ncbi:MAG: Crp/Fnr family transcriptional regulator [Clostridiales bacterium]|nr:Crp/Fnr family transcriptional regulator [Clostridiales bacterium]
MQKYLKQLKQTTLFVGIDENEIENILLYLSAVKKNYSKGEYIFHTSQRISSAALLLEGSVHIQSEDYWGNLSILSKISKGDIFGESYAVSGDCALLNNAVAAKDSTVLFINLNRIFAADAFEQKFYPRLIENLFSLLARKNRFLAQKSAHMSQRTTRQKLLSYLSEQSIKHSSPSFDIPFNRQQLADFLAVDRSAMSKELCKMRDEGLLSFKKNHFHLT